MVILEHSSSPQDHQQANHLSLNARRTPHAEKKLNFFRHTGSFNTVESQMQQHMSEESPTSVDQRTEGILDSEANPPKKEQLIRSPHFVDTQ